MSQRKLFLHPAQYLILTCIQPTLEVNRSVSSMDLKQDTQLTLPVIINVVPDIGAQIIVPYQDTYITSFITSSEHRTLESPFTICNVIW